MSHVPFLSTLLAASLIACGAPPEAPTDAAPIPEATDAQPSEPPADPGSTPAAATAQASDEPGDAKSPEIEATEGCCCQFTDPAGAGLRRFSREQGRCEGAYYFEGCVDPGICDVSSVPSTPLGDLGVVNVSLPGGATVRLKASPEHVFAHGQTVIYVPQPINVVQSRWINDLRLQGWTRQEATDSPTEAHGTVLLFRKGGASLSLDLEANCQGSRGTCAWLDKSVKAGR